MCVSWSVGVITNGTAVLGLGNIGPLAAKPVMEGKAVLFKKFADLDAFDIELHETDPHKVTTCLASCCIVGFRQYLKLTAIVVTSTSW